MVGDCPIMETLENLELGPHRILTLLSQQGFSEVGTGAEGFSSVSLSREIMSVTGSNTTSIYTAKVSNITL